jgi:hypothetical protein
MDISLTTHCPFAKYQALQLLHDLVQIVPITQESCDELCGLCFQLITGKNTCTTSLRILALLGTWLLSQPLHDSAAGVRDVLGQFSKRLVNQGHSTPGKAPISFHLQAPLAALQAAGSQSAELAHTVVELLATKVHDEAMVPHLPVLLSSLSRVIAMYPSAGQSYLQRLATRMFDLTSRVGGKSLVLFCQIIFKFQATVACSWFEAFSNGLLNMRSASDPSRMKFCFACEAAVHGHSALAAKLFRVSYAACNSESLCFWLDALITVTDAESSADGDDSVIAEQYKALLVMSAAQRHGLYMPFQRSFVFLRVKFLESVAVVHALCGRLQFSCCRGHEEALLSSRGWAQLAYDADHFERRGLDASSLAVIGVIANCCTIMEVAVGMLFVRSSDATKVQMSSLRLSQCSSRIDKNRQRQLAGQYESPQFAGVCSAVCTELRACCNQQTEDANILSPVQLQGFVKLLQSTAFPFPRHFFKAG